MTTRCNIAHSAHHNTLPWTLVVDYQVYYRVQQQHSTSTVQVRKAGSSDLGDDVCRHQVLIAGTAVQQYQARVTNYYCCVCSLSPLCVPVHKCLKNRAGHMRSICKYIHTTAVSPRIPVSNIPGSGSANILKMAESSSEQLSGLNIRLSKHNTEDYYVRPTKRHSMFIYNGQSHKC